VTTNKHWTGHPPGVLVSDQPRSYVGTRHPSLIPVVAQVMFNNIQVDEVL
jgi:hypothetical protein